MNILLGFIAASSGQATIFDQNVSVSAVATRRDVGFLSSNIALDSTLTAGQEIEHFGWLGGHYDADHVKELAQKLDLNLGQKIGKMSTGNHQKVALVIALMNRPKLLILDEPTNGLDPLVQAEFNKIILELKRSGSTIFISSHILSEIEELCDNFIFIKQGRIVAQLTKKELSSHSSEVITIAPRKGDKTRILQLLDKNKVTYKVTSGDLESTFMQYYEKEQDA
jgi:ABC-2 type transport system ATP-binding protein